MENTCAHCGTVYSRPPSLLGTFCSKDCAYAARFKEKPAHRRIRLQHDHPLAGKTGLVSEARATLFDRIGYGPHPCHWCGKMVDWLVGQRGQPADALVADHVNSDPKDDSIENLVPACGSCNGTRARKVEDDEQYIVRKNGSRLRAAPINCERCGATFLAAFSQLSAGKGRFCSRSCARSKPQEP